MGHLVLYYIYMALAHFRKIPSRFCGESAGYLNYVLLIHVTNITEIIAIKIIIPHSVIVSFVFPFSNLSLQQNQNIPNIIKNTNPTIICPFII